MIDRSTSNIGLRRKSRKTFLVVSGFSYGTGVAQEPVYEAIKDWNLRKLVIVDTTWNNTIFC